METALRSIEINYQTAELIPAPYSHKYFIRATINRADELNVSFQIEYVDREELTEDEIWGEGFTGSDDFEWEGTLLPVWTNEIRTLVAQTEFYKSNRLANEAENQFWLNLEYKDQEPALGKPKNRESWEYLSQELIQAIYETAKLEAPLKLIYLKKLKDKSIQVEMNVFFSKRTVKMNLQIDNTEKSNEVRWDTLNPVLKLIYAGEFLAEKATQKKPERPGNYLNVGDGLWYEFGTSLVNPSGNNRFLNDIEKSLDEISGLS